MFARRERAGIEHLCRISPDSTWGRGLATEEASAILRNVPLFKEMSDECLNRMAEKARFINLEKDQFVFHKGDCCKGIYVTVRGNVKIFFLSMEGKEHVIRIVGPGQSFAEAVAFFNKPCPASVQALSAVRVLFIPVEKLFQSIEEDSACARSMLAGLSRRLHQLVSEMEALTLYSGAQRVIGYLLQNEAVRNAKEGEVAVSLPVSKTIIASHLNLTPESLSRILHSLGDEGLIRVEGKMIHICNIEKLRFFGS